MAASYLSIALNSSASFYLSQRERSLFLPEERRRESPASKKRTCVFVEKLSVSCNIAPSMLAQRKSLSFIEKSAKGGRSSSPFFQQVRESAGSTSRTLPLTERHLGFPPNEPTSRHEAPRGVKAAGFSTQESFFPCLKFRPCQLRLDFSRYSGPRAER